MLAEFLNALRAGIHKEVRPQLLENVSNERTAVYAMPDGSLLREDLDPPLRRYKLASFSDLCDMLAPASPTAERPMVFHDVGRIVVLLDRDDRREEATMLLHFSQAFTALCQLKAGNGFAIPSLVRFLRSIKADPALIAAFRRIDFTRTTAGRTDVQHGRESLGRSVEASVQQADKIPEVFAIGCPVYLALRSETFTQVEVQVFIDHEAQKIELRVDSDDLDLAIDRAHAAIRKLLPAGIEVYRGSPA